MKIITKILLTYCLLTSFIVSRADEGMWLPMHIKRLNAVDLEKAGLQLTPEEIYSVNKSSLKDAIVSLGGFCTAEVISNEGLMLTNHHCAYGIIQANSTVDHDYLTDGFWAYSKDQEIPAEGITASFLVRMEDVSETINKELSDDMDEDTRTNTIHMLMDSLEEAATKDTHYNARVKSFFHGNEFYLFVYETFEDVRLVGAPPSAVGKFGGDTDNWMWPRHTGDFSMLRVYADKDNKPAAYSVDNVPYKPKHFLPISIKGIEKGDFSMVMGYPGSTDRYLTSFGVKNAIEIKYPASVKIRGERLGIIKEDMDLSDEVRIKYASKYARVSNYYKNFQGQIKSLTEHNTIEKKKNLESKFQKWAEESAERKMVYGEALTKIESGYEKLNKLTLTQTYIAEAAFGSEILSFAGNATKLHEALALNEANSSAVTEASAQMKAKLLPKYTDYNKSTDRKVTAKLLELFYHDIPKENHPESFASMVKSNKEDFEKLANVMFEKSIFTSKSKVEAFLSDPKAKILEKDPAYKLIKGFRDAYFQKYYPAVREAKDEIDEGMRTFVRGLRKMYPGKNFYPDANFTMRMSYGKVLDYYPRDAVYYNYFTTIEGIMEKEDPTNSEFTVPAKLKELYTKKDYGRYGSNGTLNTCFITNNDITGGNSGSPVINAKGELIGCAFDGNWEAMSGDISFEHRLQRTIVVDARYILFIVDKYAGAQNIIDELKIIEAKQP